jgi:CheY-like chemotaxis protein
MPTDPQVSKQGKVLVLDENPIAQRDVLFALRDHPYQVLMAGDVLAAINLIREQRPDLILMDITFAPDPSNIGGPAHDGFFLIESVRRTPDIETTPIVIISATDPSAYQKRIADLDIMMCLKKPLKRESLLQITRFVFGEADQPGQSWYC